MAILLDISLIADAVDEFNLSVFEDFIIFMVVDYMCWAASVVSD